MSKHLVDLPGTHEEVVTLSEIDLFKNYKLDIVTDEKSSVDATVVTEMLRDSNVVHIACHGLFNADRLEATGLVIDASSGMDGILDLRSLANLDLSQLDHLSLSSCWASDNFVFPGRQVISLPGVVLGAGAGTVLGAFWKVPDSAAEETLRLVLQGISAKIPCASIATNATSRNCGPTSEACSVGRIDAAWRQLTGLSEHQIGSKELFGLCERLLLFKFPAHR